MKILFIGHYREASGVGLAARNYLLAMDKAGLDVVARPIKLGLAIDSIPERIKELEAKSSDGCDYCIQYVLPHHMVYDGRYKKCIGFFVYESVTAKYHPWKKYISAMDEIWTCSENSYCALKYELGSKVTKIVPHCFDFSKYETKAEKIKHPDIDGNFIFYNISDMCKRKNISAIIQAFHLAFTPNMPVKLMLKLSKRGVNENEFRDTILKSIESLKKDMRIYPNVSDYSSELLITSFLPEEDINQIHATGDVYVSASHGEAWNIPAFEALCFGNPIITEEQYDYNPVIGLSCDFHESTAVGVHDTFPGIYTSNETWVQVNPTEMAKKMRKIYEDYNTFKPTKENIDDLKLKYSLETVGKQILGLLET